MTDKLICPKCKSDYINLLTIFLPSNPYMYSCGECDHRWGDVRIRELATEMKEIEAKFVSTPTPSPNERVHD